MVFTLLPTRSVSQRERKEQVSLRSGCRGRVTSKTRNWQDTLTERSPWLTRRVGGQAVPRVQWGEDELRKCVKAATEDHTRQLPDCRWTSRSVSDQGAGRNSLMCDHQKWFAHCPPF